MAIYQNINGVWTLCQRPYVLRNDVWTAGTEAWVKRSGTWVQAYEYDVTPPKPPEISLSVVEDFNTVNGAKTLNTRYIRVGVRLPGASNDVDAKLTRVLTTFHGSPPTTQFGGTYTSDPDASYPGEPWSEWRYNEFGPHDDSSLIRYKQWPRNASSGSIVPSDAVYYFTGWSLDRNGNWSVATPASIRIPKASVDMPNVVTKEARFQANSSGSWRNDGWHSGYLVQQKSPRSTGLWLYGNQFSDSFNRPPATTTIRSAKVFVKRDDTGANANANIYLYWTSYGTVASLPAAGSGVGKTDIAKVGTLAKGQGAWFDLPNSFNADLKAGTIKGLGLDWKAPDKADGFPNDYSSVVSVAQNLRCGEVYVLWEEEH